MNTKRLEEILMMPEPELQTFLITELSGLDYSINCGHDEDKNILYIYAIKCSSLPVLLIAHTDTVHDHPPKEIYYDDINGSLLSPTGLGADDRAGVFAILELIKKHECDVLFTSFEEKGSQGAKQFLIDYDKNPRYKMLVQLDNPGENGAMFYDNQAEDFQDFILSFGFVRAYGKSSDIKFIAPQWNVNAVNLSVGYYHAHKKYEKLNLKHLEQTITKVEQLLSKPVPLYQAGELDLSEQNGYH